MSTSNRWLVGLMLWIFVIAPLLGGQIVIYVYIAIGVALLGYSLWQKFGRQ